VRLDFAVSELHSNSEPNLATTLLAGFQALAEQAQAERESDPQLRSRPYATTHSCDVRYRGQAYEVSVPVELDALVDGQVGAVFDRFHELHLRSYGFSSPADECEVVTMRLVATIGIDKPSLAHVPEDVGVGATTTRPVFMPGEGVVEAAIYERNDLAPGSTFRGPAVIHQSDSTTLVPAYAEATIDRFYNVVITVDGAAL
jgi:N-methylhydantoinase A